MKLNLLPLKEQDYEEILCGWWKTWRWTPPPKNFLPENGTGGYMVYEEETPIVEKTKPDIEIKEEIKTDEINTGEQTRWMKHLNKT